MTQTKEPRKKIMRGFAVMSKEEKQRIASLGGKAAHAQGTAHVWTAETAAKAGSLGGKISSRTRGKMTPAEKAEKRREVEQRERGA